RWTSPLLAYSKRKVWPTRVVQLFWTIAVGNIQSSNKPRLSTPRTQLTAATVGSEIFLRVRNSSNAGPSAGPTFVGVLNDLWTWSLFTSLLTSSPLYAIKAEHPAESKLQDRNKLPKMRKRRAPTSIWLLPRAGFRGE